MTMERLGDGGTLVRRKARVVPNVKVAEELARQAYAIEASSAVAGAATVGADTRRLDARATRTPVSKAAQRLAVVSLAIGGFVDVLFYGKALGISLLVFAAMVVVAIFVLGRLEGVRPAWRNLWLVVPLLYFAWMVAVRENGVLTSANVAAVFVLLALMVYFHAEGQVESLGLRGYPLGIGRVLRGMFARPGPVVVQMAEAAASDRDANRKMAAVLRGCLLAVPVLVIFTFLLSSADSIFEGYVADVMKMDFLSDSPEMALRLGIILVASWMVMGAVMYALAKRTGPNVGATGALGVQVKRRGIGFTESALVLGLVNALFAVFGWIQVTVLFSGEAARTMHFEEYREYVRRGFGELLLVAVLTMLLILGLRWALRGATKQQERAFDGLSTVMIGLGLMMLVSAFMRMVVWEGIQFYINTQTRLYVRTFIVWLGLLFGWLLLTTWVRRDRFAIGAFMAAMGFLVSINMANPDADVAAYNLRRNDELSVRYLDLLSDDAVPALAVGLRTATGDVKEQLKYNLYWRYRALTDNEDKWQGWQSFHTGRWEAYKVLDKLFKERKLVWHFRYGDGEWTVRE
jgi:hypothetical protein